MTMEPGQRVRFRSGRTGTIVRVLEYAPSAVSVRLDGIYDPRTGEPLETAFFKDELEEI